jgi:membrane protease YdiL (CAAX protease family)
MNAFLGEPIDQTWLQLAELGLAFVLSALIGLERELRQKSAGLRTYTLVGFSSALIMLVSKYGFTDIIQQDRIVLDPSRIAAQIVSGIGFIGGGVILKRRLAHFDLCPVEVYVLDYENKLDNYREKGSFPQKLFRLQAQPLSLI